MKVLSIGGGPAGLYFSILMKKAFPQTEITVYERNRPEDTFGWGVVFSRETLGNLEEADPDSYREIASRFIYWDDIETHVGGQVITSTGHGFCGLARRELLMILQQRCADLGVKLEFQHEIKTLDELPPADLILAADGVHSWVREALAAQLKPTIDLRKAKFTWLGTTLPLKAFTFIFKDTPHGLFQVHAYPFNRECSTFIVECHESTWKKAGLDTATEAQTVAFCESLFKDELQGHTLLNNKSIWRTFPNIHLDHWHHGNVVLLGDAAHTAHFSIGSGTKLALEDAMALVAAVKKTQSVPEALKLYETTRRLDVLKLQRAAQTSLEWFEHSDRYLRQSATQFAFNLMTRSKRITHGNLRTRDPRLVAEVDALIQRESGVAVPVPPAFTPYKVRGLTLANRVILSPMCQYQAQEGLPNDWHLVHLSSRAVGGVALAIAEMTAVSPEGRITPRCTGIWNAEQEAAWKRIVACVHGQSKAKIGLQLGHAGRKAARLTPAEGELDAGARGWRVVGATNVPYEPDWQSPHPLTAKELKGIAQDFAKAAQRAVRAGFDWIELHFAHGYLVSSFLSPLSNTRTDEYGKDLQGRARLALELTRAVRGVIPETMPLSARISASDWLGDKGMTPVDSAILAGWLKEAGADVIVASSGGNVPESQPQGGRMYQVPFAEQIRFEAKVPVMAVGGIQSIDHVNTIIGAGRADLCAIARAMLTNPYMVLQAADQETPRIDVWPVSYRAHLVVSS
ncbi:MAG: oxidoreductase [Myxococcaceae bacterium]